MWISGKSERRQFPVSNLKLECLRPRLEGLVPSSIDLPVGICWEKGSATTKRNL